MKEHTRKYYDELYRGKKGKALPALCGKVLARELGYPRWLLDTVPDDAWEDFFPCGNVAPLVRPAPGDIILNLGCGAGIDSLALAMSGIARVRVVNLDIVEFVLRKASGTAGEIPVESDFDWICAEGEALPLACGCIDRVLLNGVLNLVCDKEKLAGEIGRVLRPGGRIAGADLCRLAALPGYFRDEPDAWAWCMSGSLTGEELDALFVGAGFRRLEFVAQRLDELFDRALFVFEKNSR